MATNLNKFVGQFTPNGSPQHITDPGFQPKVVIFFQIARNNPVSTSAIELIGFSDGSNHRMVGWQGAGGVATTDVQTYQRSDSCLNAAGAIIFTSVTGTIAMTATGFDITWSTSPPVSSAIINYIALGGSDIDNVAVGTNTMLTGTGNRTTTGLGFTPNFVMLLSANQTGDTALPAGVANAHLSYGCAISSSARFAHTLGVANGATMSSTVNGVSVHDNASVLQGITDGGQTIDYVADFVSFDSGTGFTINFSNGAASAYQFFYLAIGGANLKWDIGTATRPTTATAQSRTGLSFQPEIAWWSCSSLTTLNSVTSNAVLAFGSCDGTNDECVDASHNDAINTVAGTQSAAVCVMDGVPASSASKANFTSFNSDGWTITWDSTGSADQISSVSLAGTTAAAAAITAFDFDTTPTPPVMWTMGTLLFMSMVEQPDWGRNPPPAPPLITSQDEAQYNYPPQLRSFTFQQLDLENFNWGLNLPVFGVGGARLIGYRGQWSLRAGMPEPEHFGFKPVAAPTVISGFDSDEGITSRLTIPDRDVDQFGFKPVVAPTVITGFDADGGIPYINPPEIEDEPIPMINVGALGGGTDNLIGYRGQWALRAGMDPTEQFGFKPVAAPAVITGFDIDQGIPWMLRVGMPEVELFGFKPPAAPTVIIGFDADGGIPYINPPEIEDEPVPMINVGALGGGTDNLIGYRGQWSLRASMDPIEPFGFKPVVAPAVITGFDADELIQPRLIVPDRDVEQSNWGLNLPVVGTGGTQLMGFRGFWMVRAGMDSLDQFGFKPAVAPTIISGFDSDEGILYINPPKIEDELFGFRTQISIDIDQQPLSTQVRIQEVDSDIVQTTFFTLEQFAEVQDIPIPQQRSYLVPELDTDFDSAQSTFFSKEHYPDADEQTPQSTLRFTSIDDESFQWGFDESRYLAGSENESPYFTPLQLRSFFIPELDVDSDIVQTTFFTLEQYADITEQFPLSLNLVRSDTESEQFGFQPPTAPVVISGFDQDEGIPYTNLPEIEDELFGVIIPVSSGVHLMSFRGFSIRKVGMDPMDSIGLPTITAPTVITGFDSDEGIPYSNVPKIEDEQFGFKPPVVVSISAFDIDELPSVKLVTTDRDVEQFSYQPVWIQDYDTTPVNQQSTRQTTDEDLSQSTFFALEQYGDVPEIPVPQQQRSYFIPELDTDFDSAQSTFFRLEQYADIDEQVVLQPQLSRYDSELDQFSFPIVSLVVDDQQLFTRKLIRSDGESEQFGFQPPAPPAAITGFDQDEGIPYSYTFEIEDEQSNWGLNLPVVGTGGTQLMGFRGFWTVRAGMPESDQFGFNPPFVPPPITGFDQDEIPVITVFHALEIEVEQQDLGFATPFSSGVNIMGYTGWVLRAGMGVEVEQFGFQPPFVPPAITGFDQDEGLMYQVIPEIEDEQFQWGLNIPTLGGGGTSLMGFRGYWSLKAGMPEVEQFGFVVTVVTAVSAFDQDELPLPSVVVTDRDVEQFAYETVFVQEDATLPLSTTSIRQGVDEDTVHSTFFTLENYADADEQFMPQQNLSSMTIEDLVYWPPVVADEFVGPNSAGQLIQQVEDEQFGFQAPVVAVVSAFDSEEYITQLRSFIPEIEDEQFSWGWMPPVTKTSQDDVQYNYPPQLRSFYFQQLDIENFNWGFKPLAIVNAFDQDEVPVMIEQLALQWVEDDTSQSTFFSREQFGEVQELPIPQQISFYIRELDSDFDSSQSTFFALEQYAEVPEIPIRQQISYFIPELDTDFDMSQATFFRLEQYADIDEQVAIQKFVVQQVEDDQFGFQAPVVVTISSFDQDELPVPTVVVTDRDVDQFGFKPTFPVDASFPDENIVIPYQIRDEEAVFGLEPVFVSQDIDQQIEQITYPLIQDDTDQFGLVIITLPIGLSVQEEFFPNPPYPTTYQLENDQIGQQGPFITAIGFDWDTDGLPPNPPWPVLDFADYASVYPHLIAPRQAYATGSVGELGVSGIVVAGAVTMGGVSGFVVSGNTSPISVTGKVNVVGGTGKEDC